jgi:hypothetical protein
MSIHCPSCGLGPYRSQTELNGHLARRHAMSSAYPSNYSYTRPSHSTSPSYVNIAPRVTSNHSSRYTSPSSSSRTPPPTTSRTSQTVYTCNVCLDTFPLRERLERHHERSHGLNRQGEERFRMRDEDSRFYEVS